MILRPESLWDQMILPEDPFMAKAIGIVRVAAVRWSSY